MGQTVTLNPNLTVLMPLFRERCACIRRMVRNCRETVSAELIQRLRSTVLAPLTKPTKAQVQEELELIASLSVTIDLIAQGWRIATTSPAVVIEFTNGFSPEAEKERIRRVHLIDRDDQLRQPATRAFIKGMEKKRLTKKGWHSIYSVMRDGESLARDLSAARTAPDFESKLEQLRGAIKPYIQFVERDVYCEHTGLRLMDIWRYFRHTWVNSYKSVPGRSIMILIRDAAVENHTVVGIACLASSVVQQSSRDKWIGWDSESAIERFRSSTTPKRDAAWLIGEVDRFIKNIYIKDLLDSAIITRADLRKPTPQIIEKLLKDSERAIRQHRRYPNAARHKNVVSGSFAEWRARAETSLFRSKRTKQLAVLLSIRVALQEEKISGDVTKSSWHQAFENARFRQAVGQIVRMLKGERVGVNMMDITVCGAVAPYNLLLGGKLVCLLLCSPELVNRYEQRYEHQSSLIASSMRGAPVKRKARLVLLCTTSLYGSALSQYSRVKIPAEAVGGKPNDKTEYHPIGLSEGFGSFHISQETLGLIATLIGRSKEARKVNSIFGEGVNPLMRKIREGLELLGLPSDVLLNHGNKRVVYGVALAENFRDVLLGFSDSPNYNMPRTRGGQRTELLAEFWRRRWLLNRLEKPGILDEVAKHTVVYPIRHGAQVTLPDDE
jgi:Druantia protein DruA